ncbi:unnamed protein product [Caenorhabditis nigoni]
MTKYQMGFLKNVDWLRTFFKCEPTDIRIGARYITNYEEMIHWEPLLNTSKLVISECDRSEFITELLERRHEKQLRTHIDYVEILHPQSASIEALCSLDYISGRINFYCLDSNFVTEYVRNHILGRENSKFYVFRAAIPDWTRDQVNAFGTDLSLQHFDVDLNRTHKPRMMFNELRDDSRMFQSRKNETSVLVFHFYQGTLGFNKMVITVWSPRGLRPGN